MRDPGTLRLERFRQNEVLRESAEGLPGPFGFRCECADVHCHELVRVEAGDVDAIRANPYRLVLAVGHEADGERIVLTDNRFLIVEVG